MPISSLDAIDQKILNQLQKDGRISNHNLSQVVGLSPSPCLRRVRQLEQAGVISGYVALVSPEALGLGRTAFVRIRLNRQDHRHLPNFEQHIAGFPAVME